MFALKFDFVIFFLISFHVSDCSRRIIGGSTVKNELRYVELLRACVPGALNVKLVGSGIRSFTSKIRHLTDVETARILFFSYLHSSCHMASFSGEIVQTSIICSYCRKGPFEVYLVKAPISPRKYDAWICGGAIVSRQFIITSAACVDDVQYLYAIAGYKKYVKDANLDKDDCTRAMRKKIIYTCVPLRYELRYELVNKWSHIDIALVKVESPYDFTDKAYTAASCSYIPKSIPINYNFKYQEPGVDAIVAGWGHDERWRKPGDETNYNQELLKYAPTLIYDKEKCKMTYEIYTNMSEVIDEYMICTLGDGFLNAEGYPVVISGRDVEGCGPTDGKDNERRAGDVSCEEERRRSLAKTHREVLILNKTVTANENISVNKTAASNNVTDDIFNMRSLPTRRNGICQNDHGGPLVTWVGTHEVLIGVASVFRVSEESKCVGPFLYTSTLCNGAFLRCVLDSDEYEKPSTSNDPRRSFCKQPAAERGYDTIEKHISWVNHPDGPADNERIPRKGRKEEKEQYASKFKHTGKEQYPPNDRYGPKKPYNPPKAAYIPNQAYLKNAYAASAQYPPKNTYAAPAKNPPILRQYGQAKYAPDVRPPAKDGIAPKGNYQPKPSHGGKYAMRPQRPLHL